jgi:Transcriptional regulator, AbiEi antitoxin, Type IV TA system/Transcriptional regulator, AbiEi antitoxin N-terminal domain
MATSSHGKLNQLQQLPDGVLVDAAWLERNGYSSSLRSQYVKAGWLNQPAPRVYRRSHVELTWEQAVISLQSFMDYPLTVGGRTALEELGFAHYLGEQREVHLYGPTKPPGWLVALPLPVDFRWHNSARLFDDREDTRAHVAAPVEPQSLLPGGYMVSGGTMRWPLRLSSAERAILEWLDELPTRETFHHLDMVMEGLANLSPRRLQPLLQNCRSVKVKRLFFYFADRHRHAWLGQLDKSAIDLGFGKRHLVKGGKLDPTYLITVPEEMADGLS